MVLPITSRLYSVMSARPFNSGLILSCFVCPLVPAGSSSRGGDVVVYGHCLYDFAHTINETLKCVTQLFALMQSHSGGDSVTSRW